MKKIFIGTQPCSVCRYCSWLLSEGKFEWWQQTVEPAKPKILTILIVTHKTLTIYLLLGIFYLIKICGFQSLLWPFY